jgi:hypothetical protein
MPRFYLRKGKLPVMTAEERGAYKCMLKRYRATILALSDRHNLHKWPTELKLRHLQYFLASLELVRPDIQWRDEFIQLIGLYRAMATKYQKEIQHG